MTKKSIALRFSVPETVPVALAVVVFAALIAAIVWVWRRAVRALREAAGMERGEAAPPAEEHLSYELLPPEARAVPDRMRKRSSCFSCEAQAARADEDEAWRAQPSRCFSCQEELARHRGDAAGYAGS